MANASRNAQAGFERRRRWAAARDALWGFVGPWIGDGARVAIVGAGNGDDLPLRRIAERAAAITLIDLDPRATEGARRRLGRAERAKVAVVGHDVTEGTADAIVLGALHDHEPAASGAESGKRASADAERDAGGGGAGSSAAGLPHLTRKLGGEVRPLPGAPYDLVIGDLFYSQLLYPALLDLGVDAEHREAVLRDHAPALTRDVVARLHASAPLVVHVHDPLAWWDGHEQPVTLDEVLECPDLVATGTGPHESDPRAALADLGLAPTATALWRWPFSRSVDCLAAATLVAA